MRCRATACATRINAERGVFGRLLSSFQGSGVPTARIVSGSVVSLLTVIAASAGITSSAQATKYFDSFFGGTSGTPALGGTFGTANGGIGDVAVNDPSISRDGSAHAGWIYVVDRGNNRIQAFDSNHTFQFAIGRDVVQAGGTGDVGVGPEVCTVAAECKAGVLGGLGGEFNVASGIDVDQATGHFFVRERNNNRRVQEFEGRGAFVRAWGWNVVVGNAEIGFETCFVAADCQGAATTGSSVGEFGSSTTNSSGLAVAPPDAPNGGQVYVADPGNRRVQRFTVPLNPTAVVVAGAPIGSAAEFSTSNHPIHIAVDGNGVLYGSNGASSNAVVRYGTQVAAFGSPLDVAGLSGTASAATSGLEVDGATGNLVVGRTAAVGVLELGSPQGTAVYVDTSLAGQGITPNGLGVRSDNASYYVSTSSAATGSGIGHRVLVLDDNGVDPQPTVRIDPASAVESTTATITGAVNPNGPTGFPTSYRVELSRDGVSWVEATPDALVGTTGDGSVEVPLRVDLEALEANTLYRVRVVTTRNPAAGTQISAELFFHTDPGQPKVETVAAQQVSSDQGTLVGRLNPGGLVTEYWFEWGDDNYGNQIPVLPGSASGSTDRIVGETLHELEPERHYHFRLCAQNSLSEGPVCGADRTFMTRPEVSPPDGARAYEMVTSPDKVLRRGGEWGSGLLRRPCSHKAALR
jgi:hypothetical protein